MDSPNVGTTTRSSASFERSLANTGRSSKVSDVRRNSRFPQRSTMWKWRSIEGRQMKKDSCGSTRNVPSQQRSLKIPHSNSWMTTCMRLKRTWKQGPKQRHWQQRWKLKGLRQKKKTELRKKKGERKTKTKKESKAQRSCKRNVVYQCKTKTTKKKDQRQTRQNQKRQSLKSTSHCRHKKINVSKYNTRKMKRTVKQNVNSKDLKFLLPELKIIVDKLKGQWAW